MAQVRYDVYRFVESEIIATLRKIPTEVRVGFALLCAWRLLPAYDRYCYDAGISNNPTIIALADKLRQHLMGFPMAAVELEKAFNACLAMVPQEDPWIGESQAYAESAATALAYAFQAACSDGIQEALWASTAAYEAVDYFAGTKVSLDNDYNEEARINHIAVQSELARQWRDLSEFVTIGSTGLTGADWSRHFLRATLEREQVFITTAVPDALS
jgi:uncharacterized protein YjaG (DUF416 family)